MRIPVFIAASPNTQLDDFLLAVSLLFRPWKWFESNLSKKLEKELESFLSIKHALVLDSARSGIYLTLKALGIGEGDEVILPSFTCLVVANAVRWTKATPIYLDSNLDDFNANYEDISLKISDKTKAILVQHTFGKIIEIEQIKLQTQNYKQKIYIIEDWAHSVSQYMQLQADVAVLTFGIEKLISGVRGGAILTNIDEINQKLNSEILKLPKFPLSKTLVNLTNPIFWYKITPLHALGFKNLSLGALIRWFWRKLGFLGNMIEKEEHEGKMPKWFPAQASPSLSLLAFKQLKKLNKLNTHRTNISKIYDEYLSSFSDYDIFDPQRTYIRYPLLLKDEKARQKVWNSAKDIKITLGDWYQVPLYSKYVSESTYSQNCFVPASTPNTLILCKNVVNLPTSINISEKRARELAQRIRAIIEKC